MIDRRGLDQAGARGGSEQKEGEAVGAAGNGNANAFGRRHQRSEVGGEAIQMMAIRNHKSVRAELVEALSFNLSRSKGKTVLRQAQDER